MKTSAAGRAAIAQREGNKLKAYKDTKGILTIGVGHTSAAGPPKVTAGLTITASQSDEILSRDLAGVEAVVNKVKVPLSQNQFDALVSLTFNIGNGAFAKSTLLKRLNKGDYAGAREAILMWNKPKEIIGRRKTEYAQFGAGKPASPRPAPVATIPAIEPKPAPAPTPATDKAIIASAQRRLAELKYNPGGADGVIGPLTAGAIRVFRADNNMPEGDFIDDAFLLALATAKPREMIAARANATASQVAAAVPEANMHWWTKYIAAGAGAPALIAGAADSISPAKSYIDPLREMAADVPGYVWLGLVGAIAIALFLIARRGEAKSVEAFKSGDRR